MSARQETLAALALALTERLGPRRIAALVDAAGSARAALEAVASGRLPEIDDPDGRLTFSPRLRRRLERLRPVRAEELGKLAARGIRVVVRGGPGYPDVLEHLSDPPPVLWLRGPQALPERRAVAVVGTRRATEYGRRTARDLALGLVAHGYAVVSGMATGIDGAAHRGALDGGGRTVGVLGSGLDRPYPSAHRDLFGRMRRQALLASEFPPDEGARRGYFPRRNRIIAALARAVVVVQAGRRSGALNTVGHALDLGREVLAVPGPVGAPGSAGVHGMLRDGAAVATSAEDVLHALGVSSPEEATAEAMGPAGDAGDASQSFEPVQIVARQLRDGPRPADELARAAGLPTGEALALLARLEVAGVIKALPGGRYERARPPLERLPAGRVSKGDPGGPGPLSRTRSRERGGDQVDRQR